MIDFKMKKANILVNDKGQFFLSSENGKVQMRISIKKNSISIGFADCKKDVVKFSRNYRLYS